MNQTQNPKPYDLEERTRLFAKNDHLVATRELQLRELVAKVVTHHAVADHDELWARAGIAERIELHAATIQHDNLGRKTKMKRGKTVRGDLTAAKRRAARLFLIGS